MSDVSARPAPFESLRVWQLSHEAALEIYRVTLTFPVVHRYGLAAQLQRAAAAVPANLAEGNGRTSRNEYAYFCRIAKGSTSEVRYFLRLARDLGLINEHEFSLGTSKYDRVGMMLHQLIKSLRRKPIPAGF
jgi:four helix bundle protein